MPSGSKPGRVDIHSHLLPGVDDGCRDVQESLNCARLLVSAGYSHAFCTPHVWPSYPGNNVTEIGRRTADLQRSIREAGIPLELLPGGESGLHPSLLDAPAEDLVTLALSRKHILVDTWEEDLSQIFWPTVRRLQSLGLKVILAHPERMEPVQADPKLVEKFLEADLLLQGNLQCFTDPLGSDTRTTAERLLMEHRYFVLATDTHRIETLAVRLGAFARVVELVGVETVAKLTIHNPRKLLPRSAFD